MCLYVLSSVLLSKLRFPHTNNVLFVQLFVGGRMSYLRYLCLFAYSDVQHVLCFCFIFLRLVYPMLPVSLYCVVFLFCFSPSSVPYVASFSGLSILYCPFCIL